jgi:hypothetical protein
MKYREITEVEGIVKKYFDQNPNIHLGASQLVEVINHNRDPYSDEYIMPVEIKIAALTLTGDGYLNLDKAWRLHKAKNNESANSSN